MPRNGRRSKWSSLLLGIGVLLAEARAEPPREDLSDPRRPGAIQTRNVPPVPDALWERLAQYQNIRHARFQDWEPQGHGILIATRFGNSSQLHRVEAPGGRREQISFFDEPVSSGGYIPHAEDQAILLTLSRGGNENEQVLLLDRKAFRSVLLTDGTSRHLLQAIRRDGSRVVIGSNRRNGRDTDLFLADPRQAGSLEPLLQVEGEHWSAVDWSADGRTLLLRRYVSINESTFATFDLVTKERTDLPLPGGVARAAIGDLAFAADGRSIWLTTDAEGEFLRLVRYDRASGRYERLAEDIPWDVSELKVEPETGRIAFIVNADGASQLYWLEGEVRREVQLPLGIVSDLKFSPDGKQLGFTLARPDAPADAYSVSLPSGRLTRWTYSEVGGLDPQGFIKPARIHYQSFDERRIPAYYFRPRGASAEQPAAVLISIHGGPESQYRPFFTGSSQFLVKEFGIAVLHPNVRGSAGYGKTYLQLDNGERREDSVKDIGALLDWIARQPELDSRRVAVMGGSYGGYMVLASLVHFGDRIRAGVDIVGIANFETFLKNTSAYRQDLRRAEYGDERDPRMLEVFRRISPANHADRIRSALFVAHGRNDPRVPFSEAEQIVEKVRAGGRPVWTVYADNEGHGFSKKDNDDYVRAAQALFLKSFLLEE